MPFLLRIQEPLDQRAERGETAGREVYQRMLDYTEALRARGVLLASSALTHVREGQSLRLREGRRHVVDGPFAETKEMVGGFFLVDVPGREAALALAAECPAAHWATVEVRETGPCYVSR